MSTRSTDLQTAFDHWTALHAWWTARQNERAAVGRPLAPRKIAARGESIPLGVEGHAPATPAAVTGSEEMVGSPTPPPSSPDTFQGADLSHPEFELLWAKIRHEHANLPPDAQRWVNDISLEARQANVSFHTKQVQTERSYQLCRALVTLAASGADDDILQVLLVAVLGEMVEFLASPNRNRGAAVGSLNAAQATRFAELADQWAAPPPDAA